MRSLRELGRRYVLEPAKRVNPNVRIILKYPCWYDNFCNGGYDVAGDTEEYDGVWIGTETREPQSKHAGRIPQAQASWIAGWMNEVAGKKCGGAWLDPIDTLPETYVEQARETILGGARETLLHCFDCLGADDPGIVLHGTDQNMANGHADAEAFRQEADALAKLAALVHGRRILGIDTPKALRDPVGDGDLCGFAGMLGIPVLPACREKDRVPRISKVPGSRSRAQTA